MYKQKNGRKLRKNGPEGGGVKKLKRFAVACNSGFPLPLWIWIIGRVTNTCITGMLSLFIFFRLLSAKSRAYCCCLQFWLPIACVFLDYYQLTGDFLALCKFKNGTNIWPDFLAKLIIFRKFLNYLQYDLKDGYDIFSFFWQTYEKGLLTAHMLHLVQRVSNE